jgi:hypothetical protein
MKYQRKREKFEDIAEIKPEMQAVSNSIAERDFQRCFQQWEKGCILCANPVVDYFEGKITNL